MKIALLHKHYNEKHLEDVMSEMIVRGNPTIQAVWMECYGIWVALEGCHRIRAAKQLGLEIQIKEVEYSEDVIELQDYECKISDICDQAYNSQIVNFED